MSRIVMWLMLLVGGLIAIIRACEALIRASGEVASAWGLGGIALCGIGYLIIRSKP